MHVPVHGMRNTVQQHLSWAIAPTGFWFYFFLIFRFWGVRSIKLAISSAFERTLIYRIVSYREYELQVNKFEEIKQRLVELW